jgi:hypothetical protein
MIPASPWRTVSPITFRNAREGGAMPVDFYP